MGSPALSRVLWWVLRSLCAPLPSIEPKGQRSLVQQPSPGRIELPPKPASHSCPQYPTTEWAGFPTLEHPTEEIGVCESAYHPDRIWDGTQGPLSHYALGVNSLLSLLLSPPPKELLQNLCLPSGELANKRETGREFEGREGFILFALRCEKQ